MSFFCTDATIPILEEPGNHTVPVGANATFHCITESYSYWMINGTPVNDAKNITRLREEGIIIDGGPDSTTSTYNRTMSINALPRYNNTIIVCVTYSDNRYSSPPAKLTVIGTYALFKLHAHNKTTSCMR